MLGWTCLNHFSASLSTFISFLCRGNIKESSVIQVAVKGFIHCTKSYWSRPGLASFYTHHSSSKTVAWKKKSSSLGPAPHPPTHLCVKQGHHLCRFIILQTCIWHAVDPELCQTVTSTWLQVQLCALRPFATHATCAQARTRACMRTETHTSLRAWPVPSIALPFYDPCFMVYLKSNSPFIGH